MVAFDGAPVSTWTQLGDAIRRARPGSPVTITVVRDGKTLTLHTTLATVSGRSGGYLGIAPTVVFSPASPFRAVQYAGSAFEQVIVGSAKAVAALPGGAAEAVQPKDRASTPGGQVSSVVGAPRPPVRPWPPTSAGSTRSASCCC